MENSDAAPAGPGRAEAYASGMIEVLSGLEPVRRRPGMYIGDTRDGSGLHHLAHELLDNVVNEHLEGRCFHLEVTLHAGGALTVEDDGPGIPVEPPPGWTRDVSPLEVVFTMLHAGGWNRRRCASGRWGVGVACVNAVSEQLVVEVRRDGWLYRQGFRRGRPEGPPARVRRAEGTGTRITLHPDPLIFSSTAFDAQRLMNRLREIAFLNPGLCVDFADERRPGQRKRLHGCGIASWVALLTEGQSAFPEAPIRLRGAREGLVVDIALRWTRASNALRIKAFADLGEVKGGAPLLGLRVGVAQGIKAATRGAAEIGSLRLWRPRALRAGLVAVLDLRGAAIEIEGCCRDQTRGDAVKVAVQEVVASGLAEALRRDRGLLGSLVDAGRPFATR